MTTKNTLPPFKVRGWSAVFGSTVEALAIFRITLGTLLVFELVLRFRFLHVFYSDEGCVPMVGSFYFGTFQNC